MKDKQPGNMVGMRTLFIIAMAGLAIALLFATGGILHYSMRGPVAMGRWAVMAMQGELLVARDGGINVLGIHWRFWMIPLEVLALPFALPCAVWTTIASHRQPRTRGFPIAPPRAG